MWLPQSRKAVSYLKTTVGTLRYLVICPATGLKTANIELPRFARPIRSWRKLRRRTPALTEAKITYMLEMPRPDFRPSEIHDFTTCSSDDFVDQFGFRQDAAMELKPQPGRAGPLIGPF